MKKARIEEKVGIVFIENWKEEVLDIEWFG